MLHERDLAAHLGASRSFFLLFPPPPQIWSSLTFWLNLVLSRLSRGQSLAKLLFSEMILLISLTTFTVWISDILAPWVIWIVCIPNDSHFITNPSIECTQLRCIILHKRGGWWYLIRLFVKVQFSGARCRRCSTSRCSPFLLGEVKNFWLVQVESHYWGCSWTLWSSTRVILLQFFLYFLAAENRFVSLYLLRHFVGRRLLLLCSVCLFRCASDLFFCYFVTGYLAPRGSRRREKVCWKKSTRNGWYMYVHLCPIEWLSHSLAVGK